MESVTFVTEPLAHPDFVQYQVVAPLLARLRGRWDTALAAPWISDEVASALEQKGIRAIRGSARFPRWLRRTGGEVPTYIWSWTRDSVFGWNQKSLERAIGPGDSIRINFSMTSAFASDCWFVQSRPLGPGLEAMRSGGLDVPMWLALNAVGPVVDRMDWRHLVKMSALSDRLYTSTGHVARWFGQRGVRVDGVFPIYYAPEFQPSTRSPSRDYILGYLGKETDATAMRMLLDTGLPVRLFGSKSAGWVSSLTRGRSAENVRVMGHVSREELRDLYSNALVTAFPFTEESFGLVPVESMACGTPVLTYGAQGPGESVLHEKTGWTVDSAAELVDRAAQLYRDGYPLSVSRACLARARDFSLDRAWSNWEKLLTSIATNRSPPEPGEEPKDGTAPAERAPRRRVRFRRRRD
ncbi:MAG TPA: glycosyltransferase [Thermoplasmata archaeon]|nr:glycosyltransferase [Thermoplasmata archaeon]